MPSIVLIVGAAMVLAGAGETYYGSGIIEIERGWSTFISGTVLLTGGLVVLAAALLLRSLGEIRLVLVQLGGGLPGEAAGRLIAGDGRSLAAEPALPLRGGEPAAALDAPALQIEPRFAIGDAALAVDHAAPLVLREEIHEPAASHDRQRGDAPAAAYPGNEPSLQSPSPPPPPPPPQPTAAAPTAPTPPALDDWLDQEFADLDREMAQLHAGRGDSTVQPDPRTPERDAPERDVAMTAGEGRIETRPPQPAPGRYDRAQPAAPPSAAPDVRARMAPAPVEPPAPAPATAPPLAPAALEPAPQPITPQPAVIGRYQADGTSYVMFADGSIEAQSDAGIYRFASMAELKAFIET